MATINLNQRGISINGPEFAAMASELQANILKSHGRRHTAHIFFRFNDGKQAAALRFLQHFAETEVTTARQQHVDTEQTKLDHKQRFVVTVMLSAAGYSYLAVPPNRCPKDPRFASGMKASNGSLLDPPVNTWDTAYQGTIHGMVLVALGETNRTNLDRRTLRYVKALRQRGLATVLCVEEGDGIQNNDNQDIEHFGYVDGISQPKFFLEEVANTNRSNWDPLMPLNLVLVPDPGGNVENSFGSYFVFRKLEQNVRGFKEREKKLAKELFHDDTSELAGAMAVGRFENGTPVTLSDDDVSIHGTPIPAADRGKLNNFNYGSDTDGARCPFHSHIRKSTPRGDSAALGGTLDDEKNRMMARRGIIYGHRFVHPNEATFDEMPTKNVGLLFMSFQRDIAAQFEFIQQQWVNDPNFSRPNTGKDPVIGQGPIASHSQHYATRYNDPASIKAASAFGGFVTLKGGEYLFSPSMSFLLALAGKTATQKMAMHR
jgi:Dyp-type peroxidase family